jgi:hypothetical protein
MLDCREVVRISAAQELWAPFPEDDETVERLEQSILKGVFGKSGYDRGNGPAQ